MKRQNGLEGKKNEISLPVTINLIFKSEKTIKHETTIFSPSSCV